MKSKSLGLSTKEKDAGSLRPLIYSAPTPGSVVDHGSLLGLGDDDHSQYVHISAARTITAQHSFAPASSQAPFTLGVNARGELVVGLNADKADGYDFDQSVVQASSPIFGGLTLNGSVSLDGDLNFQGAQKISTTSGNLELDIAGNITIPSDTTRLYMGAGSDMYFIHSGSVAYWINSTGSMFLSTAGGTFTLEYPADGTTQLILRSDENDADGVVGSIAFQGLDSGAGAQNYAIIKGVIDDPTAGSEVGAIVIRLPSAGWADRLRITPTALAFQQATSITTTTGNLILAPSGDVNITGHFLPTATDAYDVGSASKLFRSAYISEMHALLFVEDEITIHGGWFVVGHDQGTLGANIGSAYTRIDFGKAMVNGDFVLIRAEDTAGTPSVEYIGVGTLYSGTEYYVTRNLDGSGANNWSEGVPFLVLGASGDGRIEIVANSTEAPNISILEQGVAYNASTERVRIGNMRNAFGVGASNYWGFGVGDYSGGNYLKYDSNGGFEVGVGGGKILIDTDGIKLVEGGIAKDADGRMQWHRDNTLTVPIGLIGGDDLGVGGQPAWGYPRHVVGLVGLAKDSETEGGGAYIHGALDTSSGIGAVSTATIGVSFYDHITVPYGEWAWKWAAATQGPQDIMRAHISGAIMTGTIKFNPTSDDIDFIVSTDSRTYGLMVDAGTDRVGIGIAPTDGWGLHIYDSAGGVAANANAGLVLERAGNIYLSFIGDAARVQGLVFGDNLQNDTGAVLYYHDGDYLAFRTGYSTRMIVLNTYVRFSDPIKILESAAAVSDDATYGQYWVKNTTPNRGMFTADNGWDYDLIYGGWVAMPAYTYVTAPYSATCTPYNLTVTDTTMKVKEWVIGFYTPDDQDAGNHWTITLRTMNITTKTTIAQVGTAGYVHGNWQRYKTTSVNAAMTGIENLVIEVTPTGSPGYLYISGPVVFMGPS